MTVYEQAVSLWGADLQVGMFAEECAEASAAAIRFVMRGRGTEGDLASEVADVEIMCAQMRVILGDAAIDVAKSVKEARLQSRIRIANEQEER